VNNPGRIRYFQLVLVLAMTIAGAISAPAAVRAQSNWRPALRLDNDVYNFWKRHTRRPDEEYTNGVHASLESQTGPWWGRHFAPGIADCVSARATDTCRATVITLGQDLYTPHLDRVPYAVEHWELERPYFAWLYVSGTARVLAPRTSHSVSLSIGVTGPPAGGAMAQDVAHRIGFNEQATGWETQIGFEPGIVLEYRRQDLLVRRTIASDFAFDLSPDVSVALGSIRTNAAVGGTARLGRQLSHPWHPPSWSARAPAEWWVSAGGRTEYVARDMSLDGTLVNPTRRVERIADVYQYEFGAGLRLHGIALEYRAVTRSREYRTGPVHHTYSSMIVSLAPR
jgi:lipid A 3-O-deacylase